MSELFPGRRLSWWRLTLVVAGLGLLAAVTAFSWRTYSDERTATGKSWSAPYVDVTATPRYPFEKPAERSARDVVLSFIVAGKRGRCTPTWGAAYTLDQASEGLDLDRRVERLRQQEGSVVVSFGGQRNDELAVACADDAELLSAYRQVVERYELSTIDLDIEGEALNNGAANRRRAAAIASLQRERNASGDELAVWVTLPTAVSGLTEAGTDLVTVMLEAGVTLSGVNVMTMNFGEQRERGQSMASASKEALTAVHRQVMLLYGRAGHDFGPATTWKRLGATPMLGQNDTPADRFTLEDAEELNAFAVDRGLGRMSLWSLNRDRPCGENYPNRRMVSDSCSGLDLPSLAFSKTLGKRLTGAPDGVGADPRVPEPPAAEVVDDPARSPYPIWRSNYAYLAGTKVVWKRNVYEAKWWTRGDQPDDPVLQMHETPWALVGPVLEGEKPIEPLRLSAGTYARWNEDRAYRRGDRVMLEGEAFEAKWWTRGDNPFAGEADPDSAPWVQLTDTQKRAVLDARGR